MRTHFNMVCQLYVICASYANRSTSASTEPNVPMSETPTGILPGKAPLLLEGAQMSSFGRKRKLRNMHEVSVCLCGQLARPTLPSEFESVNDTGVVCCKITGCETKWVSNYVRSAGIIT